MRKLIIGTIIGIILGSGVALLASSKYESSSTTAQSIVGYGYNGTTLVPLKVDVNGTLAIQ